MVKLNLCLSDIPKDTIRTAKNGKKYLDVLVAKRRSGADERGNDLTVMISLPQNEQREKPIYIGSGRTFENSPRTPAPINEDDLPF